MNTTKIPTQIDLNKLAPITIIGCGSIGSKIAELLIRSGYTELLNLYDDDIVNPHNLVNQYFYEKDITKPKVEALKENLLRINPSLKDNIIAKNKKYLLQRLAGVIILAVDSIDVRRTIVEANIQNPYITYMIDIRVGLYDSQSYMIEWNQTAIDKLLRTMQFTHEEAKANYPVSPCGTTLGLPTTANYAVNGVMTELYKVVKGEPFSFLKLTDSLQNNITTM